MFLPTWWVFLSGILPDLSQKASSARGPGPFCRLTSVQCSVIFLLRYVCGSTCCKFATNLHLPQVEVMEVWAWRSTERRMWLCSSGVEMGCAGCAMHKGPAVRGPSEGPTVESIFLLSDTECSQINWNLRFSARTQSTVVLALKEAEWPNC